MKQFIIAILLLNLLHSTTLSGNLYDGDSMKSLGGVLITAEDSSGAVLVQKVFSTNYSLVLSEGNYLVRAYSFSNGSLQYYVDQDVKIGVGNAEVDLILLPYELVKLTPGFIAPPLANGPGSTNGTPQSPLTLLSSFWYVVLVAVIAIIIAFFYFGRKNKETKRYEPSTPGPETSTPHELDEDCQKVLQILRENEGRMVQKELRDIMNFSETKMSLVVTELEIVGMIKKIKKGRENILKLIK